METAIVTLMIIPTIVLLWMVVIAVGIETYERVKEAWNKKT